MPKRFVVLPSYGFRSTALAEAAALRVSDEPHVIPGLRLARAASDGGSDPAASWVRVLDTISEDGPKLVEMTEEGELALRRAMPGIKVVPIVTYQPMVFQAEATGQAAGGSDAATATLRVTGPAGEPVERAKVVAFTDYRNRIGANAFTDAGGTAHLTLAPGSQLERLYVYGPRGYWGRFARGFSLQNGATVALKAIDPADPSEALKRYRGTLPPQAGEGIVVGIVDSGIDGAHPLLPNVSGGANLVFDELRDDPAASGNWGPATGDKGEHGTHVAGIVAARGTAAMPISGIAPGATLRSYRVFPNGGGGATNYDISLAIDRAVADGCHVINLSLGGLLQDEAVRAAIGAALDSGVIVVAAAGNGGRKPVAFPASLPFCIAVSAMGWQGSFPEDSSEASFVAKPFGDPETSAFVALFSNFGPQVDLTGPGVGVVSTVPGGCAASSGTSMACPAVAGFAAYLLGSDPAILGLAGSARAEALTEKLYGRAVPFGFGRDYEGFGLPLP